MPQITGRQNAQDFKRWLMQGSSARKRGWAVRELLPGDKFRTARTLPRRSLPRSRRGVVVHHGRWGFLRKGPT